MLQIDLIDQLHEDRPALLSGCLLQKPRKIGEERRNRTKICQRQRHRCGRELRANHIPITLIGHIINKAILIEPRKPLELGFQRRTLELAWVFCRDELARLIKCRLAPCGRKRETTERVEHPRFADLCHTPAGSTVAAGCTPATTI
ncbi:MAG: hypothetical protein ACJ8CR_32195 [Roseiflexaceae bacterium]